MKLTICDTGMQSVIIFLCSRFDYMIFEGMLKQTSIIITLGSSLRLGDSLLLLSSLFQPQVYECCNLLLFQTLSSLFQTR